MEGAAAGAVHHLETHHRVARLRVAAAAIQVPQRAMRRRTGTIGRPIGFRMEPRAGVKKAGTTAKPMSGILVRAIGLAADETD